MTASPGQTQDGAGQVRQARSEQTQAKLLQATIDLLVEVGFAHASTPLIARRAGVSRGAQTHHFPTRIQLVTAAIEWLADRRLAELELAGQDLPGGTRRIPAALDLLWTTFGGDLYKAVLELWIASRTDPELRHAVASAERRLGRQLNASLDRLFGEPLTARPQSAERAQFVLSQLRGLALLDTFDGVSKAHRDAQWAFTRQALITFLTGDSART
ncbi:TetR family transcriptional regulator [Tamaricihabitans halophyticus]|uniref:TetR family transcriptional regulator n=1 Tax=Tamaricihabitans halophyticus TaxID=1262583 RepID=A0A4R2Q3L2_9PSEU|nr:TetR/AcrR family transcriptional regulator [Tamaricihabitans halophyticus]TCP41231.1 TetR family transcriptional regulator [Tamaricihabitans halophyticus]